MGRITGAYAQALRFVLAYPFALAAACLALIVASFFCYRGLGSDLLPAMDEGGFILDYLMPAGSSLADTNQVLLGVEKILLATPEVESTSRRTGLELGLAAVSEPNTGDIAVYESGKNDALFGDVNKASASGYKDVDPSTTALEVRKKGESATLVIVSSLSADSEVWPPVAAMR